MKLYTPDGKLIPDVLDILYELGNAGTGMASVTLGRMLDVRISISTPKVILPDAAPAALCGMDAETEAVAIIMYMRDTLTGSVLFIIKKDIVAEAVKKLTGRRYAFREMLEEQLGFSAVQEFGNLVGAAYVKAIGGYTGVRFRLSPVVVAVDKVKALLTSPLLRPQAAEERQIVVESDFSIGGEGGLPPEKIGQVRMLPDERSVERLMEAIGL